MKKNNNYSYIRYTKRFNDKCIYVEEYIAEDWREVWNYLRRCEKLENCELHWFEKIDKKKYDEKSTKKKEIPCEEAGLE